MAIALKKIKGKVKVCAAKKKFSKLVFIKTIF